MPEPEEDDSIAINIIKQVLTQWIKGEESIFLTDMAAQVVADLRYHYEGWAVLRASPLASPDTPLGLPQANDL